MVKRFARCGSSENSERSGVVLILSRCVSRAFQAARWVRGCVFNAVAIALLRSLVGDLSYRDADSTSFYWGVS